MNYVILCLLQNQILINSIYFVFIIESDCKKILSVVIPMMSTLLVYVQGFCSKQKNKENIFIFISFVHFYSSLHFII